MLLEPVIYMKKGSPDYSSYPIGSIILSASGDVGQDWLRCDGSFINADQYPELVAYLGRHLPDMQDAVKAGEGQEYAGTFSTSCIYDGFVWAYWFEGQKLLGWLTTGEYVNEIDVEIEGGQLPFTLSADVPVVLSICEGRTFLTQTLPDLSNVYMYTGQFTSAMSLVTLSAVDVNAKISQLGNHGYSSDISESNYSIVDSASGLMTYLRYLPEVVLAKDFAIGSAAKDCFLMLAGAYRTTYRRKTYDTLSYVWDWYALAIPADDISSPAWALLFTQKQNTDSGSGSAVSTLLGFSRRMSGEFIALRDISSGNTPAYSLVSQVSGVYDSNGVSTTDVTSGDPVLVQPVASREYYIYRAYILGGSMYIRAGKASPFTGWGKDKYPANAQKIASIQLPDNAKLFPNSLEYIASHNLFVIFVGCGMLFSRTPLDMNSWGYLDTTGFFGLISQLGSAEFDAAANTLCLSGIDSYGSYCTGLLKLHTRFDYATDGAWLPYIVSSGIPAWIKSGSAARYLPVETVGGNEGPGGPLEGTTGSSGASGGNTGGGTGGGDGKPSALPDGYTGVEYVQMGDRACLNTSVSARTNTVRIVLEAQLTEPEGKDFTRYWLSELTTNHTDVNALFYVSRTASTDSSVPTALQVCTKLGHLGTFADALFQDFTTAERFTFDYNGPEAKCSLAGQTASMDIHEVGLVSLYLGLAPQYSSSSAEKLRVYSLKIYVSGELKRDFVPCTNASGAAGLYDKVGGYFAASATQSELTAGPAVQES